MTASEENMSGAPAKPRTVSALLEEAVKARGDFFDPAHESAVRLFNGFYEGCPLLSVDILARTAVIHNYAEPPEKGSVNVAEALGALERLLPWIRTVILKTRAGAAPEERRGVIIRGTEPDRVIREHGVLYAVDPLISRDTGFFLDTRNLRGWALRNLKDKTVLNTFAHTGSLGVAALAGGAARVVQLDKSARFLETAKKSCALNGLPVVKGDYIAGDFWVQSSRLRRAGALFDCVFLDPPFFAAGRGGTVSLDKGLSALINKVRPLISDGGFLAAVSNALFVSGKEYMAELENLCSSGYLRIAELIPVPRDFIGYSKGGEAANITDPAPFNHSTKIVILEVHRKEARPEQTTSAHPAL
jgi:23S rRNA (cytosine1962-C5)-methyltransferase